MNARKFHSLFLALALLLLCFALTPNRVQAAEIVASGECGADGDNLTWTLDDAGTLTISGTGAMMDNAQFNAPGGKEAIKTVEISNGVTRIGVSAFFGCTGLTDVIIGNNVTSIGAGAFYGCTSLTGITIPASVTSIEYWAFTDCTGLTDVYITDINAWWRISFDSLEANPTYYADNVHLIDAEGNEVTGIMFGDSVTQIPDDAFAYFTGLTDVIIGNSVTSIGAGAFLGCTGLTNITIPDSVTSIGASAFYGCTGLTNITIPAGVTKISTGAFNSCTGLTSVTIEDGVADIGDVAFAGCTGLTGITIPDSVTGIGYAASTAART